MGLRFHKSVSLGKGLRLNFGKKGMSVTTGVRGAHVTYSTAGKKTTSVGIPGTGISYVKSGKIGGYSHKDIGSGTVPPPDNYNTVMGPAPGKPPKSNGKKRGCGIAALAVVVICIIFAGIGNACKGNTPSSSSAISAMASCSKTTSSSKATLSSSVSSSAQVLYAVSSGGPSSTAAISAVEVGPAKETTKEPAATTAGISVTKNPGTVQAGSNASLSIKGKPNTSYSINVYYSTKASDAAGLSKQTSDSSGNVTWKWKVGPKTKAGSHRIVIQGGDDKIETSFTTTD